MFEQFKETFRVIACDYRRIQIYVYAHAWKLLQTTETRQNLSYYVNLSQMRLPQIKIMVALVNGKKNTTKNRTNFYFKRVHST